MMRMYAGILWNKPVAEKWPMKGPVVVNFLWLITLNRMYKHHSLLTVNWMWASIMATI